MLDNNTIALILVLAVVIYIVKFDRVTVAPTNRGSSHVTASPSAPLDPASLASDSKEDKKTVNMDALSSINPGLAEASA